MSKIDILREINIFCGYIDNLYFRYCSMMWDIKTELNIILTWKNKHCNKKRGSGWASRSTLQTSEVVYIDRTVAVRRKTRDFSSFWDLFPFFSCKTTVNVWSNSDFTQCNMLGLKHSVNGEWARSNGLNIIFSLEKHCFISNSARWNGFGTANLSIFTVTDNGLC